MERIKELIPIGKRNRPGVNITLTKITIHNTGNDKPGANARAHSKFLRHTGHYRYNGRDIWVSWHFTVDDHFIILQLPLNEKGYHAGGNGNNQSIGIEICMYQGINQNRANDNAAMLVAYLCLKSNLTVNDVVPHKYWTGKNCPQLLLSNWTNFINRIKYQIERMDESSIAIFEEKIIDDTDKFIDDSDIDIEGVLFTFEGCSEDKIDD